MTVATITRCDGVLFKRSMVGAHAWLRANREKINQLNVFPVPDGDTGTNMLMTLESAIEEIGDSESSDLSDISQRVAHGALMGARGNSGVILSQILRGFAQGVADSVSVDTRQMAQAFADATTVAYKGVTKPTEGTILTVARAVSTAAARKAVETDDIAELIQYCVSAAQRAVDDTPGQLAVLREAGVVDAGGYGLMVILEGFLRAVKDQPAGSAPAVVENGAAPKVGALALAAPDEGWGFCTEFLLEKPSRPFEVIRAELTPLGNSAVIVGDDALVRVHIHTLDPGGLVAKATTYGPLSKLKVEDMTRQHHEIVARDGAEGEDAGAAGTVELDRPTDAHLSAEGSNGRPRVAIGVVAVAAGDGFRRIFEELGAGVVEGGQTMNPSTEDLLQAVQAAPSDSVIILPNNKNVIMSAQQVRGLTDKKVAVVATRTVPQGISALLNLDPDGGLDANARAMDDALGGIQTVEVTRAVRSTSVNGLRIKVGDVIALTNGAITQAGQGEAEVIDGAIDALLGTGTFELCTVYGGADVTDGEVAALVAHLQGRFPALSVEAQRGEQSHYPYILSLE